jgi:hypothetical protein
LPTLREMALTEDPEDWRPRTGGHLLMTTLCFVLAAVIGVFGTLSLFSVSSREVDPGTLSPGEEFWVSETASGSVNYVKCPSPLEWLTSNRDQSCRDEVRMVGLFSLCSLGLAATFAMLGFWQWHRRRTIRSEPSASLRYLQDGMPSVYWLSATIIGLWVALLVVAVVPVCLKPEDFAASLVRSSGFL